MDHFKDYLPILAALIAISSAAVFGFLLPKWTDYFNDRSRTKLKDTLDIKKSLESRGTSVKPEFEDIINFYENEFVRKELEFIKSCEKCKDRKLDKYLNRVFGLMIIIPLICLATYVIILGIVHWLGY
jgi:hypothetical protein